MANTVRARRQGGSRLFAFAQHRIRPDQPQPALEVVGIGIEPARQLRHHRLRVGGPASVPLTSGPQQRDLVDQRAAPLGVGRRIGQHAFPHLERARPVATGRLRQPDIIAGHQVARVLVEHLAEDVLRLFRHPVGRLGQRLAVARQQRRRHPAQPLLAEIDGLPERLHRLGRIADRHVAAAEKHPALHVAGPLAHLARERGDQLRIVLVRGAPQRAQRQLGLPRMT